MALRRGKAQTQRRLVAVSLDIGDNNTVETRVRFSDWIPCHESEPKKKSGIRVDTCEDIHGEEDEGI